LSLYQKNLNTQRSIGWFDSVGIGYKKNERSPKHDNLDGQSSSQMSIFMLHSRTGIMLQNRFLILLILCSLCHPLVAQLPFKKGVNLTQWFQAPSARQIQFTKFTVKDFQNIKSLGCDVIRLPINLHAMTSGAPNYTLDPILIQFLDSAVAWSEQLSIYLILDNHSFDPAIDTQPDIQNVLVKVWTQLARHYKDSTPYLLYEILNEPHGISSELWGDIQQEVINAIRALDTSHYVIVGGSNYNSYNTLASLPVYEDDKVIYTFHFYDPFLFTHQGAGWVAPPLVPLANIPFPYDRNSMPALPSQFNGTWIETAYNNYEADGTVLKMKQLLDVAIDFRSSRNVPVFCGEFGVYIPNSDQTQRVAWYQEIRKYLDENNIPWTMWDYTGGFGAFEQNSNEVFENDLNVPLLEALKLEIPVQKNFSLQPKTRSLIIYDDYAGEGIITSTSAGSSVLDYYSAVPYRGKYAIQWRDGSQYESIGFDFQPDIDLSLLPSGNYELKFWVRGNLSSTGFDIRFVDTKSSAADHPWRMGKTVDYTMASWDEEWHEVIIPLKEMEEKGSWDERWFAPENKFQWAAVDRFEIVAEQASLSGSELFFDDIMVVGEEIDIILDAGIADANHPLKVFPNPSKSHTIIEYTTTTREEVTIEIYNPYGQVVRILSKGLPTPGTHKVVWSGDDENGSPVSAGIYLVRMRSQHASESSRVIVLH
jgi:endoglucanase